MIPIKFKKIKAVVLLAGPGSGSKLFQSFVDGHKEVLMTPGYILMYFYPHWEKHFKYFNSWINIIECFLVLHPSLINSEKLRGGDYLYNLGEKKKEKIQIDKKFFIKRLLFYLHKEEITSKNFFIAIHLAYAESNGENLNKKRILFYHMHVCWYLKKFYEDFNEVKTITMIRELKSNIPKRIPALEKPNMQHLNFTDAIFFRTRSYKNIIFEDFFSLNYLKRFKNKSHKVIKHEELISRKINILKNFCKYTKINFVQSLKNSTINGLKWNYKHEKKINLINGVAEHILKYDKKNFYKHELFWLNILGYNFNKKYSYNLQNLKQNFFNSILCFIFIFLPSKKEVSVILSFFKLNFFTTYLKELLTEISNKKIKLYENNAFYFHKWSNKYFPFNVINFFNNKIKYNRSFFWILAYIILKFLLLILFPLSVILEYFMRVLLCQIILLRNLFNLDFYPKKL